MLAGCLRTWLETNGTCPVCRFSLVAAADGRRAERVPLSGEEESTPQPPDVAVPSVSSGAPNVASPVDGSSEPEPARAGGGAAPIRRSGAAAGTDVRAAPGAGVDAP